MNGNGSHPCVIDLTEPENVQGNTAGSGGRAGIQPLEPDDRESGTVNLGLSCHKQGYLTRGASFWKEGGRAGGGGTGNTEFRTVPD
jgi:hypothetical protein